MISPHHSLLLNASSFIKDAVTPTLGPNGSEVIIHDQFSSTTTKDGATVAKFLIPPPDIAPVVSIIKQAATNTLLSQGDGTTTSILFTTTLLEDSIKYLISTNKSPASLKRELTNHLPRLMQSIDSFTVPSTPAHLLNIATIASDNDPLTGKLIYDLYQEVTLSGTILIEDSPAPYTTTSITDGYSIERGFMSSMFAEDGKQVSFDNPLIFITDSKLKSTQDIVPFLEYLVKVDKPGVIIADDFDPQVIQLLIVNTLRTPLKVVAIKAPSYSEMRHLLLQDMAVYTSSEIISENSAQLAKDFRPLQLGTCKRVIVKADKTTFINVITPRITSRVDSILSEINTLPPYLQQKYALRASSLLSKVGTIHVGAPTEAAHASLKAKIDDAVRSIKQADLYGVIPGGGYVPLLLSLDFPIPLKGMLLAPIRLLAPNPDVVIEKILSTSLGYNASTSSYEDLLQTGVVDPASTLKEALTTAITTATLLLNTHYTIHAA